jgi:hypothetical protein
VRELPDDLSEPGGLVLRDEGVAVRYLDQASLRDELGQAPPIVKRHDTVWACPDDEGVPVEGG